jgi:hypothetical protein
MPFRLGLAYGPAMVDPNKFRLNLAQRYVKVTVQSGEGQIEFASGLNIRLVTKNGVWYNGSKETTLTVNGQGLYQVYFE